MRGSVSWAGWGYQGADRAPGNSTYSAWSNARSVRRGRGPSVFEVIVVGNEVLRGSVLDTNSNWLAARIYELGAHLRRITTVRDEIDEVSSAIREAIKRGADYVITAGGLGPTFDDLTLSGVAKALGRRLVLNREAAEMLRERYRALAEKGVIGSPELTPARLKMAMLPRGARPLRNRVGSAPGVILRHRAGWIVSLPGVPAELKDIYTNELEPILKRRIRAVKRRRAWMTIKGVTESALAPHIDEIRSRHREVYIKSHPQGIEDGVSKIVLEMLAEGIDERRVERSLGEAAEAMRTALARLGATEVSESGEERA